MNCSALTNVKICGITNPEDALAACEAGADALGFVFAPEAKKRGRYIGLEAAARIVEVLPPYVVTVGVCVNDSAERLREYLTVVDRVQLCGEESPALCEAIAPQSVMKVFHVGKGFDTALLEAFPAGAVLLDASVPGEHGGTGVACDWDAARAIVDTGRRVVLAGGLTPGNVGEAVRQVRPYGVDVSGGVESAPGKKDHDKLRSFIHNAKSALSLS